MLFNPPVINHIDDVMPHIQDKPEFIRIYKEEYTVIDYVYSDSHSFDNEFARECRGLKFDPSGKLVGRPYHKFHNLGENPEYATANIDLSKPHDLLVKLDGSMVHNVLLPNGEGGEKIVLMTRKGNTEVARAAEMFLHRKYFTDDDTHYYKMMREHPEITFIFEYVAPTNRIVIEYKEENLILTGARYINSGEYLYYPFMKDLAKHYDIPVVDVYPVDPDWTVVPEELYESIKLASGVEGAVVRFATGAMAKIKGDEYVRKHRSKDLITKFRDVVKLILEDQIDDILPQLDEETKGKVITYRNNLLLMVTLKGEEFKNYVDKTSDLSQKEFAERVKGLHPSLHSFLFSVRKTNKGFSEVKRGILKAASDTKRLTNLFADLSLPIWEYDFFSE